MPCAEGEAFVLLDKIKAKVVEGKGLGANALFPSSESINTIDGVRVEYADGFGLARPSNTTPIVVMRFEADSQAAIERIQAEFKQVFLGIKSDVKMPF
jgi:phosphomannomutase/phosphoglucomutase